MTDQETTQAANITIQAAYGQAANEPNPQQATLEILQRAVEMHTADLLIGEVA